MAGDPQGDGISIEERPDPTLTQEQFSELVKRHAGR